MITLLRIVGLLCIPAAFAAVAGNTGAGPGVAFGAGFLLAAGSCVAGIAAIWAARVLEVLEWIGLRLEERLPAASPFPTVQPGPVPIRSAPAGEAVDPKKPPPYPPALGQYHQDNII